MRIDRDSLTSYTLNQPVAPKAPTVRIKALHSAKIGVTAEVVTAGLTMPRKPADILYPYFAVLAWQNHKLK